MALIGNNADTLLNGLSAFWHRFFRDINDVQAAYEGGEVLLGQVYLNFMSDVLNTSVVETPLFRKEYYKLITVREDQLVYREHGENVLTPAVPLFYGNPGMDRYTRTLDVYCGSIPALHDRIFSPSTSLEEGVDYRVEGYELQFKVDPTDPVLPGFAKRRVTIGIGGKFLSSGLASWVTAGVEKGDTLYFSETIDLGTTPDPDQSSDTFVQWLALQNNARTATVVQVTPTKLSVSVDTPLPTFPTGAIPAGFSWRIIRRRDDGQYNLTLPRSSIFSDGQIEYTSTLEVNEISFWATDVKVDDFALYNTYGYFFTSKHASTEAYRSLIRGLMQLYILGPALARLESALNLTAGLPTIIEEGETLIMYDSGLMGNGLAGTLTRADPMSPVNIFTAESTPFSTDAVGGYIKISSANFPENIGTFNIVERLSSSQVRLKPYVPFTEDTALTWLYTKDNKQVVTTDRNIYEFPLESPMRSDVKNSANFRVLTFQAFEPLSTAIQVTDYIQDPDWWHDITIPAVIMPDATVDQRVVTSQLYPNTIGPTSDGYIGDPGFYIGADEDGHISAHPFRHKAAFILMDRFMKLHMFAVLVDQTVQLTGLLVNDLQKVLQDVKPVHTALYFRPLTSFTDVITLADDLAFLSAVRTIEEFNLIDNQLLIGSAWHIGDTWKFSAATGGSLLLNGGAGYIPAIIGGPDPLIQPANPTGSPPGSAPDLHWIERPLYVNMHT